MKINQLALQQFMIFNQLDIQFSHNINVICGENSTGKTTILKMLYSVVKPLSKHNGVELSKDAEEKMYVSKLQGVFRPDGMKLGRLVSRKQGSNQTKVAVMLEDGTVSIGFGNRQESHAEIQADSNQLLKGQRFDAVYIPTKEMISTTEHFASLYEEYHLDFEETYYDLAKLLDRPLSKGANTKEQRDILNAFGSIMNGQIVQKNKKFYLKMKGQGEIEMGLLSDGYRKLAMLVYMILSGSISKDTILFWDEPETNMNPKTIRPIVQALLSLAKMGVQIFVTTHDYFVQQEFNMICCYPELNREQLDIRFFSLYRDSDEGEVLCEQATNVSDLEHNAIMEEFDALYDREQRVIYGN